MGSASPDSEALAPYTVKIRKRAASTDACEPGYKVARTGEEDSHDEQFEEVMTPSWAG